MKATPYFSFNGNCEEAVKFYQSVLGGELEIRRFDSLPADQGIPISDQWKEKVMHCNLVFPDGTTLFFSDTWEDAPVEIGTNAILQLNVDSEEEVHRITQELSAGGTVTMPADRTFWGSVYGSFFDRFGVQWCIEYELPQ
jgi:PhnB protein